MEQITFISENDTVFIIDEDLVACNSLSRLIDSMGLRHECFASSEEFLSSYVPGRAGCVITDYRMVGMSGIELLEELTNRESALAVVMLTADGSIPVAVKAIQSGAIAFLEKSCTENELWQAIKDAIKSNHSRLQEKHDWDLIRVTLSSLTDQERTVLELVVEGQGNKQIALKLDLSLRTVEHRRQKVKQKLKVGSNAELVRYYDYACTFEKNSMLRPSKSPIHE
ncbi:MAG: hypothetical protein COA78_19290 [Blastopirellula sp.]|nr:MAG: hypothetical protein COA78_19290 [Blastopirellula sp.]